VALIAVPVAAATVLAVALVPRGEHRRSAPQIARTLAPTATSESAGSAGAQDSLAPSAKAAGGTAHYALTTPAPSARRAQKYSATIALTLPTSKAISDATTRALRIVHALGGYPLTVRVDAARKDGDSYLVVKVPRTRVQDAVRRLGALGTIVGENVQIQDLQGGVDTTSRRIDRLRRKLVALHNRPQTDETKKQIAAIAAQLERLRLKRAATLRAAQYATVRLQMETPSKPAPKQAADHGPLHGLGIALHWVWIGAVYALVLGGPLVLLVALGWFLGRGWRRRREERLLSRS
jgi:hypothetical protein